MYIMLLALATGRWFSPVSSTNKIVESRTTPHTNQPFYWQNNDSM
jgi:hypothetical protein